MYSTGMICIVFSDIFIDIYLNFENWFVQVLKLKLFSMFALKIFEKTIMIFIDENKFN